MKRKVVPIVAGSKKILGLTQAEWNINLLPFGAYIIWVPGWWIKFACVILHLILISIYVQISKRFEQDYIIIYMQNRKIPNILYGIIKNPLPLNRLVSKFKMITNVNS